MKLVRITVCVSLILAFSSCSFAPDYIRPEVPLPERYAVELDQKDNFSAVKWEDFYRDPALLGLIRIALEENKDIKLAAARIEQSRAVLGVVEADLYPLLNIGGQAGRADASDNQFGGGAAGIQNDFGAALDLSYQLDFWGRYRNATESARYQLLASELGIFNVKIGLMSQVAKAYFIILDLQNQKEIAQRTLGNRKEATALIKARFEQGVLPELDLNQAEIEQVNAAVIAIGADRGLNLAKNALAVLMGRTQYRDTIASPQSFPEFADPSTYRFEAKVLSNRPDVIAAEDLAKAALFDIGVAKADRLPGFSIGGLIGFSSNESNNLFDRPSLTWNVGGEFMGPLIDFGKGLSNVELAEARAKEAMLNYESTVLQAAKEVEDAIIEMKTFKEENDQRELQIKAASNASRLSRARYFDGFTSYLEVLDIERSLFEAELAASENRQRYYAAVVKLYAALGGGWEQILLSEQQATAVSK